MSAGYVDSSALLSILLREDPGDSLGTYSSLITSEITDLECRRTLDRVRIQEKLPDHEIAERFFELDLLLRSMRLVQLAPQVLKRAKAPFPTVVRSLDAIHLATAEITGCTTFISRDRQQLIAAKALGFRHEG